MGGNLTLSRGYLSAPIHVAPGQSFDELVVTLEEGAVVTGRVLSADGTPAAGARVATSGAYLGDETTSDQQGRYRLAGLAAGATDVFADHPALGTAQSRLDLRDGENRLDVRLIPDSEVRGRVLGPDGAPVAGARAWVYERGDLKRLSGADGTFVLPAHAGPVMVTVESDRGARMKVPGVVSAGRPLELEIRLTEGGRISGRISGLDRPQDAGIRALRKDFPAYALTTSDAQGVYHFRHLEPGVWTVSIDAGFNGRERQSAPVQVDEGRETQMMDFDFLPMVLVRGRVVGPDGQPAAALRVNWQRSDGVQGAGSMRDDGTFALSLETGSYVIAASLAGFAAIPAHIDVGGGRSSEPIELRLRSEQVLTGRILGLDPGQITGFLYAEGPNGFPSTYGIADQEGGYRFTGLSQGTWTVRAEVEGNTPGGTSRLEIAQTAVVSQGAASVQDLIFPTGDAELTGRIEGEGGGTLAVELWSTDGLNLTALGTMKRDGTFRVTDLRPGSYRLRLREGVEWIGAERLVTVPGEAPALHLEELRRETPLGDSAVLTPRGPSLPCGGR